VVSNAYIIINKWIISIPILAEQIIVIFLLLLLLSFVLPVNPNPWEASSSTLPSIWERQTGFRFANNSIIADRLIETKQPTSST